MIKSLTQLRAEREKLEKELAANAAEINVRLKQTLVVCIGAGCGKASEIGDLTYYQTHSYIGPSGCTDGDYWRAGEGRWTCPHCLNTNRLWDKPDIVELKHLFKDRINVNDIGEERKTPRY